MTTTLGMTKIHTAPFMKGAVIGKCLVHGIEIRDKTLGTSHGIKIEEGKSKTE